MKKVKANWLKIVFILIIFGTSSYFLYSFSGFKNNNEPEIYLEEENLANESEQNTTNPTKENKTLSEQNSPALLQGFVKLDLNQATISKSVSFGKGNLGGFVLHAPFDESLILESLTVTILGANQEDVPEVWLKLGSSEVERIFSKATVVGNQATFYSFPTHDFRDVLYSTQEDDIETHVLIETSPFRIKIDNGTSLQFGLYAKWNPNISTREPEQGIGICVEELSGTLGRQGYAKTSFAQPYCWVKMGVK